MRLPTGGTITYAYTGGDTGTGWFCADGSTAGFYRQTPDGQWKYLRSGASFPSGTITTTTVTDPQTNQTVYTFGGTLNFELERQIYTGTASGTPLETIITCYNGNQANCATTQPTWPVSEVTKYRQLNGGPQSKLDTLTNSYGLVTSVKEYDFGASTPTRVETVQYDQTLGNGIVDRPSIKQVTDGGGNSIEETDYTYDEDQGSLQASGASQLVGITCSTGYTKCRGNATTVRQHVTASSYLTKTYTHYDTGQAYQATDVNGAVTTYSYGDCGSSLLTSVAEPLGLSKSFTWNCTGGVTTSATDENGQTTYSNFASDPNFWRPDSAKDSAGYVTTFSYPGVTQTESVLPIVSGTSGIDVATTLDSLGRSSLVQKRQTPSSSIFDTSYQTYDSDGRPYHSFMPCATTLGAHCSTPSTTTVYDGMGRPTQIKDGSASLVQTVTYNQNDTYIDVAAPSGENDKRKQLEYDGLGRLTSVCELTGTGNGGYTCGQTVSQTGYWTRYKYDAMDHLIGVCQNTTQPLSVDCTQTPSAGQETRIYTYDMLGRMTSESNPETSNTGSNGTVHYAYDSVSGTLCAANSPGNMIKKTKADGSWICFNYDALHRVTDVGNSLQSTTNFAKRFRYDNTQGAYGTRPTGVTVSNTMGRLTEVATDSGSEQTPITDEWFSYDARGSITDVYEFTPNSGGYYHSASTYWPHGAINALSLKNSSGALLFPAINYGGTTGVPALDGEGRFIQVTASSGVSPVTSTTYVTSGTAEPIGALTSVTFGSQDSDTYQYDLNTGRMTQYSFNVNGQSDVGNLQWNANASLKQLQITDPFNNADSQTCTYSYDDLKRSSGASCGSVWAQSFAYDAFGNTSKSGSSSWTPLYNSPANDNVPFNNQYKTGWNGIAYDGNGNLLYDTFHTYQWNVYDEVSSIDGGAVVYDALDRQVEYAGGTYQFVYQPGATSHFAVMSGQTLQYAQAPLPGGGQVLYHSSGVWVYLHSDWLNSGRLFSTPSRTIDTDNAYAPFGEKYAYIGGTRLLFAGANGDTAPGLYDFLFRKYSPTQGRWILPDPAGVSAADPADPQSWNRYAYVDNVPTFAVDPDGTGGPCPPGVARCYSQGRLSVGIVDNGTPGPPQCTVDGVATPCGLLDSIDPFNVIPIVTTHYQPWSVASRVVGGSASDSIAGSWETTTVGYDMSAAFRCTNYVMANCGSGGINAANNGTDTGLHPTTVDKYNPMERGKTSLRDSNWFCSTHVTIDQTTGQTGSHADLFNPEPTQNQASPTLFWLHIIYDGTPDFIYRKTDMYLVPAGRGICK